MRPPKLSPDSYLRLLTIGDGAPGRAPSEDAVTVVRGVGGDVAHIRGELETGRVALTVVVDCELFSPDEIDRIIAWVRRAAERKRQPVPLQLAR